MADKEITTFVVDLSPSMGEKYNNTPDTNLDIGLKYFYDLVIAKVLRGRKTDYVSVIAVNSPLTDNPYAGAGGSFQNIEVVCEKIAPLYSDLKFFRNKLIPNSNMEFKSNTGDCFEGLVLAVLLLKDTLKLKFTRNIVVITNGQAPCESFELPLANATKVAMEKLSINLMVIGVGFEISNRSENFKNWSLKCKEYNGTFLTGIESNEAIQYHPPLRKVRPMKYYHGQLRFGSDYLRILDSKDDYSPESDVYSLTMDVECYPAAKIEPLPSGHSYVVKNDAVSKVSHEREYYVQRPKVEETGNDDEQLGTRHHDLPQDDSNDSNVEIIPIDEGEKVKGFKYSNYDLIALDRDLEIASTLHTMEGMDIVGFFKHEDFPFAYLTEESFYVVPASGGSSRNILAFNLFCKALLEMKSVAMVRYVQKDDTEVKMCILMPTKVNNGEGKFIYTCSMTRMPFKEDENLGRFPYLTPYKNEKAEEEEEEEENEDNESSEKETLKFPTKSANKLMESFILAKDLDGDSKVESSLSINIPKAVVAGSAVSSLPKPVKIEEVVDSKLTSPSPALHKFNLNLRRIIFASLQNTGDLHEFLDNPDFVKRYLVSKESNMFNLGNVLKLNGSVESDWLKSVNKRSLPFVKDLVSELGVKYVSREEAENRAKRRKPGATLHGLFKRNPQGTFGANEGEYDEMPDLDRILQ